MVNRIECNRSNMNSKKNEGKRNLRDRQEDGHRSHRHRKMIRFVISKSIEEELEFFDEI